MTAIASLRLPPGPGRIRLGELTGRDELGVNGRTTGHAVSLLDGLLSGTDQIGANGTRFDGASIASPDRDRILGLLYAASYGDKVTATADCHACGEPFDVDFSMSAFVDALNPPEPAPAPDSAGWIVADGVKFRFPTGADEIAVDGLAPDAAETALAARCVADGPADMAERAMSRIAPLGDRLLDASCPACATTQALSFSIQHFVLGAILADRAQLTREIHRIASAYGWSLGDILSLPRSRRRMLAHLIEGDIARRRGERSLQ